MKKALSILLIIGCFVLGLPIKGQALSAKSAVVLSGDTGEILYSYNCNMRLSMASTTKIMTGLILCESGNLDREITVTAPMVAVEGSSMGLRVGDVVTLRDLLYGLMLPSGNDAANAIAISLCGSIEKFAQVMNQRAKEMGLTNTHFVTPSGLDADEHYTTAYELALIAKTALSNEEFADVVATKSITLSYGGTQHYLSNHNKLLSSVEGVIGVKTGFTKKSGRCLVSAYKKDGRYVIAVTLNDPNDWADHKALINIGIAAIKDVTVPPEREMYTVSVVGGTKSHISFRFENATLAVATESEIVCKINVPPILHAPLCEGEKVGYIAYYKGDELVLTEDIRAPYDVPTKRYNNSIIFYQLFNLILSDV